MVAGVGVVEVRLVVEREGESPLADSVVAGRRVEVFSAEDEVQSDSLRPISHPSCFKPAMINIIRSFHSII